MVPTHNNVHDIVHDDDEQPTTVPSLLKLTTTQRIRRSIPPGEQKPLQPILGPRKLPLVSTSHASRRAASKLTNPRPLTPSRTQNPWLPIMFAIMMSVDRRSPTIAIWSGRVTPESGCARKYASTSALHPGFLVECCRTLTPVAASRAAACVRSGSLLVPAVLDTIRSLVPG